MLEIQLAIDSVHLVGQEVFHRKLWFMPLHREPFLKWQKPSGIMVWIAVAYGLKSPLVINEGMKVNRV